MRNQPNAGSGPSPEEVLQRVEEATAAVEKQLAKARRQFSHCLKLAEERLAYAEQQLEEARQARAELEAHAGDPEGARLLAEVQALGTVFGATRRMMQIEIACHRHNLERLEMNLKRPPTDFALRLPEEDLDYMEARAYMDVHLAILQMTTFLDGVDLVLRATSGEPAIVPSSDEELIARRSRASELRQAMKQDETLEVLVTQLGGEVQEAIALLDWGKGVLARLPQLPVPVRRGVLEDADWARLNGRVQYLRGVGDRAAAYPALAGFFPAAELAGLPYERVEDPRDGVRARTGPLS